MGLLSNWSNRAIRALEGRESFADDAMVVRDMELPHMDDVIATLPPRMQWDDICRSDEYKGRWVALDECRSDEETGRVTEGSVVDVDDDLVELCARIRESDRKNCAILFCDPNGEQSVSH